MRVICVSSCLRIGNTSNFSLTQAVRQFFLSLLELFDSDTSKGDLYPPFYLCDSKRAPRRQQSVLSPLFGWLDFTSLPIPFLRVRYQYARIFSHSSLQYLYLPYTFPSFPIFKRALVRRIEVLVVRKLR